MWRVVHVSRGVSAFVRSKTTLSTLRVHDRLTGSRTPSMLRRCQFSSSEVAKSRQGEGNEFGEGQSRSYPPRKHFREPDYRPSIFPKSRSQIKNRLLELLKSGEGSVELLIKSCSEELLRESPSSRTAMINKMWDRLSAESSMSLGVSAYNALAAAYIHNSHDFCPKEFLVRMQENDIMPNSETLYLMLLRYCHQGDKEGAKKILEHMQNAGIPVTEKIYHALIHCHGRANDMAGAHSVFDALSEKGITVTDQSYGALAVAYAEQGDIGGVHKILKRMSEARIFPSHQVYLSILRALGPHPEYIPEILDVIKNKKYMIADVCRLMVDLSAEGHFDAALNLLTVVVNYSRVFNRALFERSVAIVTKHMMDAKVPCDMAFELSRKLSSLDSNVCRLPRENLMLYMYDQDDPAIAISYAKELASQGIPLRTHYFFPVLVRHISAEDSQQVVTTLETMMELGLSMFDHNLISLFQPLVNEDFMLKCFKEATLLEDHVFVCELIQYFWVKHRPDLVLKLLFTLPISGDVRELLKNGYSSSIANSLKYVVTTMIEEGDVSDAVVTTLKLAELELLPAASNSTVAVVMKELARKGDRTEFYNLVGKLKDLRYPLNDRILREVIHFTSAIGDLDKCMATFNQLQIRSEMSYSELLRVLCMQKRVPQAESCYREMLAKGFTPQRNHMSDFIKLFLDMGDSQAAEEYRKEMESFGYDVHHALRQDFIRMYCMKGDFEKAKAEIQEVVPVLQEMSYNVVYPRVLLMKGYLSHGSPEGITETLEDMKSEGLAIEPAHLGLLLEAYSNCMDHKNMLGLLHSCKDTYGVSPSLLSVLRVLNKLVASSNYDTATEVESYLKTLYNYSEKEAAHAMLFAELVAGHKEKALDMAMTKSFDADKQRLLSFIKQFKQTNRKDMIDVVKQILEFHQTEERDED